jgi:hypothetical protein
MSEWRTIESAPINGTSVLLWLDPPLMTGDALGYSVPGKLRIVVGWASDTYREEVEWNCGFMDEGTADTDGHSIPFMISVKPKPGDWIIKGVKGEFYPCKPDIFAATYDSADAV